MTFRDVIRRRARGRGARIVLAEGDEPRVRDAAEVLRAEGIAEPILLGGTGRHPADDAALDRVADLLATRRPERVQDRAHARALARDPLRFAAGLVALGEADGAIAGAVATTADVIRAALWAIGPDQEGLLSSAFYLSWPNRTPLTFTDCAVVVEPDATALARIAYAAARDRRRLVGDAPRVAFLSYSTRGSAEGGSVDRIREAVRQFRVLAPDVPVDGELQADAALVAEVALRKAPDSPLGGEANVLVFPSLDAGNIGYKLVERLGGASAAGPLFQGLARPMSDLSRGARVDDIVDVAAMVALQAQPEPHARELAWDSPPRPAER